MALILEVVFLYILGIPAQILVPTTPSTTAENYMTIRGYKKAPRCDYETCQSSNSCRTNAPQRNLSFSEGSSSMPCFCDSNCLLHGDCCFDYFETCLNVSEVPEFQTLLGSLNQSLETVLQQQRMLEWKECRDVTVGGVPFNYWIVARCPNTSSVPENDVLNCEMTNRTVIGRVPVTLIENPSVTFANYHCAVCHGLERRQVRFWQSRLACNGINPNNSSFADISKNVLSGDCTLIVKQNADDVPRVCIKHIKSVSSIVKISTIPNHNLSCSAMPRTLCSMYSYPVKDPQSMMYKNPHCVLEILHQRVLQLPLLCAIRNVPTPKPHQAHSMYVGRIDVANSLSGLQFMAIPQKKIVTPIPVGYTPGPAATPYHGPTYWPIHTVPFGSGVASLNILFNFGENDFSFNVNGRDVRECKICPREDEVYITYSKRCVKLECAEVDTRPVNGTCRLKEKVLINGTGQLYPKGVTMFVVSFQVQGMTKMMDKFVENQIRRYFATQLAARFINETTDDVKLKLKKLKKHHLSFDHLNPSTNDRTSSYQYALTYSTNVSVSSFINRTFKSDKLFSKEMKHNNLTITQFQLRNFYSIVNENITKYIEYLQDTNVRECPNGTLPKLYVDVDLVSVHKTYYARLRRMYYDIDNIVFQIILEERQNSPTSIDIVVCVAQESNDTLHCPNGKVTLRPSEYRLDNGSLILISSEVELSSENFTLTADGAIICNIFSREIDHVYFFNYNHVQTILTMITSIVSIFSLVLVLLIYCCLRELRNLPGKIVMCLSLTLLLAQMFQLLINIPPGLLCTAVASLVHTTWLSSFMWMTMLSVDLTRSLRSMSPIAGFHSHSKFFFLYAGVAWFLPILFVAVCVLVDHFNVWGVVIGYGSDHLCWISNHKASLYIFGLPVAMTLLMNVICFFLTLISIEQTTKTMSNKAKNFKNEKTRLGIYIRLMSIMGFTWIFCFAAAFIHVTLLWYFQIVLNGLQGFYIFVCFVCKSRILRLLAEKYKLPILTSRMKETPTITSVSGV